MGDRQVFQPLTREDKITVVLYRIGIVLSTGIVCALAWLVRQSAPPAGTMDALGYGLVIAIGMSVFFIHLYIGKFKIFLKYLYYLGIAGFGLVLLIGKGSASAALAQAPASALFLLPLSGCLGFITAKEAFCFKLLEGYILAIIMPVYLVLVAATALTGSTASGWLIVIAAMLLLFTLRKAFMPAAYDIGDKSAYQ